MGVRPKKIKTPPPQLEEVVEKEIRWFIREITEEGHILPRHDGFEYNGYNSLEEAQEDILRYLRRMNDNMYEYHTPTLYNGQTSGFRAKFFVIPQIYVHVFHRVVQ